jgi:alcohol dehydrogenase class IV
MFPAFNLSRLPRIVFGNGARVQLPALASAYGKRLLLVTGAKHFQSSPHWEEIQSGLKAADMAWEVLAVSSEPSPEFVDQAVLDYRNFNFDAVVGLGGGSALDAAKAIAGLLKTGNSVMDHLEGVGPELPYRGPSTPFIAVPTTAGTGSEVTKNAVLSIHGPDGFKKSFRDEKLVAEIALVDPDLLASCLPQVIAANGMDAFTQLLESYVSNKANRFTDALAWSGMKAARNSLQDWYRNGPGAHDAQAGMAYAALLSGITLAQVGLGSVHGLASPLGAFFPIPHGIVCGTLVAEATNMNIQALQARAENGTALLKYAQAGRMLAQNVHLSDEEARSRLIETLGNWTEEMRLPRLSRYGVTSSDIPRIVSNSRGSSMKTNPVVLTDEEIGKILSVRL